MITIIIVIIIIIIIIIIILLANRVSDSSRSKCFRDNVCSEIPFRVSSYHMKCSQLITIRDKLAGFSTVRF